MALSPKSHKQEEELWQDWMQSGRHPNALRPLLSSLQPLVKRTVSKYRTADVSPQALHTQTENQLMKGLSTYDPNRGALSTHLNWQMRTVGRFVEKHQNFARIPGSRIRHIGKYQRAQSQLQDQLGRAPTLTEIARKAKIKKSHATLLQSELQPTYLTEMMTDATGKPMGEIGTTLNPDMERLDLVYHDFTPMEQLVVDHSLGRNGKPKSNSNNELARKLGVNPARVSNIRASIAKKTQALGWIR